MSEPIENENETDDFDIEAYDAAHNPVEDVPGAGAGGGQEAVLGSGFEPVQGQETIGLSQDGDEETRTPRQK